ncbi:hypothetical protein BKA67DRAFT_558975 [Truncatella angustata]|uniref:Rhodopsin domain-containing protein n=1 Tax=Truncatella angustata TaxID=152316 RepID=A0A9P8UVG6_9PEZI|nr:uncharacterized protein BKA67DRAFT_558975 [Truncatella angustata]KAH6658755.1 hypothetical protein BKA67DRAFT_558975 [Truncatella angustata]
MSTPSHVGLSGDTFLMSDPSALLGYPPISDTDALIRRGLLIISPSQINPNKSEPFGATRPVNYEFETGGPSLIIGEAIAIFFIILFTSARLYMRLFKKKSFGLDDWMILPGAIGAAVYLSLDIISQTKGCLGKHIHDCTYTEVYWFIRIANVEQPLFYFCVFCVKLSVALANRRITGLTSRKWMTIHWIFISLFLFLLPCSVFLQAFQCIPVPARYSLIYIGSMADPHEFKCIDTKAVSLATRTLHMVTDIALLCVPITILVRLKMPTRKKARLIFIFALGGMSTFASILRNIGVLRYSDDITWQYHDVYVWNTIDLCFAVVVASLPALNSLLDVGFDRIKKLSRHSLSSSLTGRYSIRNYWRTKTSKKEGPGADSGAGLHEFPYHRMESANTIIKGERNLENRNEGFNPVFSGVITYNSDLRGMPAGSEDSLTRV